MVEQAIFYGDRSAAVSLIQYAMADVAIHRNDFAGVALVLAIVTAKTTSCIGKKLKLYGDGVDRN